MDDAYSGKLVAVLTCTAGEVMEKNARASLLESFGYEQASEDLPNLWMPMVGDGGNDCAIEISDDGKIVRLFGDDDENISNLNNILRRLGWDDYDAEVIDNVIERRITQSLASVLMRRCEKLTEILSVEDMLTVHAPAPEQEELAEVGSETASPVRTVAAAAVHTTASVVETSVDLEEERDGLITDLDRVTRERNALATKLAASEQQRSQLADEVAQLHSKLASVETRASVSADASGLPPELVREALTILVQREFADLMKGSRWAPVLRGMGLEARLQFETQ